MRMYIDEDIESEALVRALRKSSHDVECPLETRMTGESDAAQLTYAVEQDRVLVTGNHEHFEELHKLVLQAGGSHPGILTVRKDNDRRRDMKPHHILNALTRLESFLQSVRGGFFCLNDWR